VDAVSVFLKTELWVYCNMVRSAHRQKESEFAKTAAEMLPTSRAAIAAAKAEELEVARKAREAADTLVMVAAAVEKAERKAAEAATRKAAELK
jgi:hypothetical protein